MNHVLYDLMLKHLGTPYIWGGDNPLEGFDCSGLVLWLMRSVGLWDNSDTTAQGIHDSMAQDSIIYPKDQESYPIGTLVFFGHDVDQITHIGMIISDRLMIEAGGGNKRTTTRADAVRSGAQVRIRPIDSRRDLIRLLSPSY